MHLRLAKLETGLHAGEIPVWCESPEQVPETIEAMIADSEIRPDHRMHIAALSPNGGPRCVVGGG